jgi:hypothetical protein
MVLFITVYYNQVVSHLALNNLSLIAHLVVNTWAEGLIPGSG